MITSRISTNTWVMLNEDTAYHRKIISDWRCACWCRLDLDRKRVTNKYYHPSSGDDCFISNFFWFVCFNTPKSSFGSEFYSDFPTQH